VNNNCKYGTNRVIEPKGALPQPALKVDNTPKIYSNELLIDVDILNITSTAFSRLKQLAGGDKSKIAEQIKQIVFEKGKFQCPETGSGGILIGRVAEIGDDFHGKNTLKLGDKIATMVSLSLTPLRIDEILDIDVKTDQVFIKGTAILFDSGLYAKIPRDISEKISVAVIDVTGASGWTAKCVKAGDYVVVLGAGKAGLLCLHEAKKRAGATGKVIAIDPSQKQCELIKKLNLADEVLQLDATQAVSVAKEVERVTDGRMADFVVNTANVPNTEMASILACRDYGTVLFFSMSTNFSKVVLGCEGVGKVLNPLFGIGYVDGTADITFQILRENDELRNYFEEVYG